MEILLGLVPEGFHFVAGDFGERGAAFACDFFHFVEARGEFSVGAVHGDFGIDFEEASEIDGDKKQITEFVFDVGGLCGFRDNEVRGFPPSLSKMPSTLCQSKPARAACG
jgi:hypothetical protein